MVCQKKRLFLIIKALDEYSKNQNDATEKTLDAAEAQIVNAVADKKAQQALKKTTTGIKDITGTV